ncbi:permease [candidate division KSB1 bacterium]|nr:permease [candidate division KSB1 bacterium]
MNEWIIPILKSATATFINLIPYVVAGVILSETLKYIAWGKLLTQYTGKAPKRTVFWAVGIGIVSPMCTYGSLPIVLTLFGMDFPVPALLAFLIASSLMNPQLFLLTWGGISPMMAVARLAAVTLFSLIFGLGLERVNPRLIVNPGLQQDNQSSSPDQKPFLWSNFLKSSFRTLQFVGFYIVLGVILGAVVEVVVPMNWLICLFREPEWLGIFISALLGIPLYACGGGTIPLIDVMLDKGMSAGAALAFFIVGPATRITPLVALATIMRPRFIGLMILSIFLYAIVIGICINYFI